MAFDREQRIAQIKSCGQSIIENAERIYSDFKLPMGLKIIISIDTHEIPTITVERTFFPEIIYEDLLSK